MSSVNVGHRRQGYDRTSDRALIALTRAGDQEAYSELWSRHRSAATGAARLATDSIDPDDLVSEAYTVILAAIHQGGGPTGDGFRPYLCATVRNLARRWGAGRREYAVEELPEDPGEDEVLEGQLGSLDDRLVRDAFGELPRRWQEILWFTEVEGLELAAVGRQLGLKPNAVAALAFRAREGLRKAWLQAHVADTLRGGECGWVLARIGEHSRDGLRQRAGARVDEHLAACRSCRDIALEVGQVNRRLARVLLPLLAGGGAATAWLAAPATPAAATAVGMAIAAIAIAVGVGVGVIVPAAPSAEAADPLPPAPLVLVGGVDPASAWSPELVPDADLPLAPRPADAIERIGPIVADVLPQAILSFELEISLDPGTPTVSITAEVPVIGEVDVELGIAVEPVAHLDLRTHLDRFR
ncbi:MAG TPA: sigma-70 family RNA polymerase sigma factor [Microbacteriaceae bacterium]|nr:sigma-70 family RNA polymerase sigma factor [Microbacteriaceae bacterium]